MMPNVVSLLLSLLPRSGELSAFHMDKEFLTPYVNHRDRSQVRPCIYQS